MLLLPLIAALQAEPIAEAWVYAPTAAERAALTGVGFAEGVRDGWVRVHGTAADLDRLEAQGLALRDRRPDHRLPPPPPDAQGYRDPDAMADALARLAADHPDRAELVQLGLSREGRPVVALRLGPPGAPRWRVLGAHHGDEPPSAELALAVAEALLTDTPPFDGLLDDREVWVVPVVNPDGLAAGSRYNADDVDLNRNYGYQWSSTTFGAGPAPFSEPETRAVRTLALRSPPAAGLSLHTGETNIGYVFNYTTDDTVEEPRLIDLAAAYDDACTQPGFWVTQGAEWYVTRGDTNDWSFGVQGTLDFTVEMSTEKAPDIAALPGLLDHHMPAVAALLSTPAPLRGQVLDATSGRPLAATLQVVNETWTFDNDPITGRFARPLEPGEHQLLVSAPGYRPARVGVVITDPSEITTTSVSLRRDTLAELRPEPALLAVDAGPSAVTIPALDVLPDTLTLRRRGLDPVVVPLDDGAYTVDPAALTSGPWTLDLGDAVLPRALFIGTPDLQTRVVDVSLGADGLWVTGEGFAPGTRAFALWGPDRAPVPLPVLAETDAVLRLDPTPLPVGGTVDLWVVSNGRELAVVDLLGEPTPDTGASTVDTGGGTPDEPDVRSSPGYRGCQSTPAGPIWLLLLLIAPLRRTRCPAP
ncbi:MAG: DUF2817 domain-containing protein [Alphaproteobacteria bacterium]|nr:DUF2817 domain-containing protein [Alphaproteobacteria bacterium]